MATSDAFIAAFHGPGSQPEICFPITLTVAGNSTLEQTITVKRGSVLKAVTVNTPTAITGTPTHSYASVGLTSTGGEIMAATDAKAQGNISGTIVAGIDVVQQFATADTTLYVDLVTSGGTSSAGPVNIILTFAAPLH